VLINVLLSDAGLSDGDGLELVAKAKAIEPKIRAIALAARDQPAPIANGVDLGCPSRDAHEQRGGASALSARLRSRDALPGTSVAANYRAAWRARSKAEFIAKIGVVLEEADETLLWLELISEGQLISAKRVETLLVEAHELVAIMVKSRKSAAFNLKSEICNDHPDRAG
jgi:four helix bundle protein